MLEHRAREDDPVDQRHRDASGNALAERAERPARRRPVDVEHVADPRMQRRDHVRLSVALEAEMADQRGVEDLVDPRTVVDGTLVHAFHARTGRRGCRRTGHRGSLSAADAMPDASCGHVAVLLRAPRGDEKHGAGEQGGGGAGADGRPRPERQPSPPGGLAGSPTATSSSFRVEVATYQPPTVRCEPK